MRIPLEIKQKLDAFLRRYYSLKLVKGAILAIGLMLAYLLLIVGLEYGLRLSQLSRMILFYSFLIVGIGISAAYIIYPILQLLRLGKTMSYEQASELIGKYFPKIDDKLLNVLQLGANAHESNALLLASIEQKSKQISPFNFLKALEFKSALRYWPVLVAPILLVLILSLSGNISTLGEAGARVLRYSEDFKPAFPFQVELLSSTNVEKGEQYTLRVQFMGDAQPNEMIMSSNGQQMRMVNKGQGIFEYKYASFIQEQNLRFKYGETVSDQFTVSVVNVPQLNDFLVELFPPSYTGVKPSILAVENVLVIPEGTNLRFVAKPNFTDKLLLKSADSAQIAFERAQPDTYMLDIKSVQQAFDYTLVGENEEGTRELSALNTIRVIKDAYPKITAEWFLDSLNPNKLYYRFTAEDDYGVAGVALEVKNDDGLLFKEVVKSSGTQNNKYGFGFTTLNKNLEQSTGVEVYLVVRDNDAVNGSKSTKSNSYKAKALTEQDFKKYVQQQLGSASAEKSRINGKLKDQQKALKNQLNKLKKGEYDWKDEKELEEILKKQEELLAKKKELDKQKDKLSQKVDDKPKEDIRDADKEDELKKLIDEVQKLKDKLGIKELEQKLQKMEEMLSEINQQEVRQDKLEEQLNFERELLETIDKLQELAKKEEALSKQEETEKTEQQQKQAKDQFDVLKKGLEKKLEQNQRFKEAAEKEEVKQKSDKADRDMQKASQKQGGKSKKSSQKQSSESLKEMAEGLQSAFMAMQAQSQEEDAEMLRRILENVELLSSGSEEVLTKTKEIENNDPTVRKLLLDQKKLIVGTKVIKDSLTALANRNPKIKQKVFEELSSIKTNQTKSLEEMQNLELSPSAGHQQYVMLAANNLALMLDASLQNMRAAMAKGKPGDQNCQKPNGKKPGKDGLAKAQGELAKQMSQKMKGQKPGQTGEDGESGDKGELARIISQQEQLREAYKRQQEGKGKDGGSGSDPTERLMEEVEKDLYNNNITPETLERVKEIESRLLEDERAERKQEQDEQRQSEVGENLNQEDAGLLEFLQDKAKSREQLLYEELLLKEGLSQ